MADGPCGPGVQGVAPVRVDLAGAGIRLAADRWGAVDSGRGVLVLLPGGGQTRHSWDSAAGSFVAAGWVVYTVDARGHGESEWAPEPAADYGLTVQAADLESALRDIARRDPGWTALIGASMGGMAAMAYAAGHPGSVDAVVLVDITPTVEQAGVARIRAFMSAGRQGFDDLDEVLDAVSAYRPSRPRRTPESLRHNIRQGTDGRWYWHWDPNFHRPDNGLADSEMNRRTLLSAAPRIIAPTLVVHGGDSDVVSEAGVEELVRELVNPTVVSIPGAGHMVAGDDNNVFVNAVLAFVEQERKWSEP